MLALFNAIVVRAILVCVSFLFTLAPTTETLRRVGIIPRLKITAATRGDTTAAAESKQAQSEEETKAAKDKKKKKSISISITDEGLKVGSDDETELILEFDAEDISRALDGIETLESLPESILAGLGGEDSRRFYDVRGNDLVKFGETITVGEHELVRGNVVSIFGDIEVEGKVMGDIVSVMGDIELGPGAIVNGEVVSVLGALDKHADAQVRGETVIVGSGSVPFNIGVPFFQRGLLFGAVSKTIIFIIGVLLLGIVMAFLSDRMKRSSTFVFGSFFKSLGIGALVLIVGAIVVTILAVIFSITIIGIPVAILIVFSFIALCILGYFVSAIALGRWIGTKMNFGSDSPFVHGLIGLVLLAVLGLVSSFMFFSPFITPLRFFLRALGGFIQFIALLAGIGAFITSKAGTKSTETMPNLPV
ncbi:MAG TPA: polymer-forming cytoskeletal protein [Patescibacteria group bacterium]|nr:polymer-forming cytoskeletal protein [Patescibacteria group bacterium]